MQLLRVFTKIYSSIEDFFIKIGLKIFRVFSKKTSDSSSDELRRVFRFLVWGFTSTLLSYCVYALVLFLSDSYIPASIISFIFSVIINYLMNSLFIFRQIRTASSGNRKSIFRTFLGYGFSYLVQLGLLYLWIDLLKFSPYLGPILNIFIIVPLNYLLNRFWVFK